MMRPNNVCNFTERRLCQPVQYVECRPIGHQSALGIQDREKDAASVFRCTALIIDEAAAMAFSFDPGVGRFGT